jgi:DNA helicase-2/ATP-dependent DNA helicase PcrA
MPNDLLKDLNKEQQKAVATTDGPMIIHARISSGKTRVLTYKRNQ